VAQQIVGMDGAAELLREQARNLSGNVNRIVPDRPTLTAMQQLQQQNAQLQEQLAMAMQELENPTEPMEVEFKRDADGIVTGATKMRKPKNMLPDGSAVGGRESNTMSPRPNGV
jgi:orotidine-5'-phosphate decarboxylase